jgi:hypothetical protein
MARHIESEGAQLVHALMGHGLTGKDIGRAIQRNDSLISQVRRGIKPGTNLVPSLRTLLDEVQTRAEVGGRLDVQDLAAATPEPARRMSKRGTTARVRQRVMITNAASRPDGRPTFGTGDAGRQAARNGARLLGADVRAMAAQGHTKVYVSASFTKAVHVEQSGSRKDHRHHFHNEVELGHGGAGLSMNELIQAMDREGSLSQAVTSLLIDNSRISGPENAAAAVRQLVHLQVRTV